MTDTPQLTDKVAIVTGGSSGIGLAIAAAFQACGASVMIGARDEARVERAIQDLSMGTDRVCGAALDVRDPRQVEDFITQAVKHFGDRKSVV